MNKLKMAVIMLVPAIGVLTLYSLVMRDIRKQNATRASSRQAATKVIVYSPPADLPRAKQAGTCSVRSLAAPYRADAWRCMAGNTGIYDPCFSLPQKDAILCGVNPSKGVAGFMLELTMPLPQSMPLRPESSTGRGWLIQLTDGNICFPFSGKKPVFQGTAAHYGCSSSNSPENVILGEMNHTAPQWTAARINISPSAGSQNIDSSKNVSIATVWQ